MTTVPLASPDDLVSFPGAPFAEALVKAAGESVRRDAGWHIAPEVTETLVLDSEGGRQLFLPTLRDALSAVVEVRDVSGSTPKVLDGWRLAGSAAVLHRAGGWPQGLGVIEVELTHGYEACPAELLPAIAARTRPKVRAESLAGRSVQLETDNRPDIVVAAFRVPGRP
jgi:hypothetical protein